MKRIVSLLLAMVMVFSLAACSKQDADMYCTSCGHGLAKSASFCDECGARVAAEQENDSIDASEDKKTSKISDDEEETTTTTKKSTIAKKTTKKSTIAKSTTTTNKTTVTKPTTTTTKKASTTKPTTTTTTTKKITTATPTTTHKHSYTKKVAPATCTEKGYNTFTCPCGHSYTADYVEPTHMYKNYVCSVCGVVDKEHAYEYLVEWVKNNGEVDGSDVKLIYQDGDRFIVNYSAQYDNLSVIASCFYEGEFLFSSIQLDSFYYGVTYGNNKEYDLNGYLKASQFTPSSPISYVKYTGDESLKFDYIEFARETLVELVDRFVWFLEEKDIGITVGDLGLTSYQ